MGVCFILPVNSFPIKFYPDKQVLCTGIVHRLCPNPPGVPIQSGPYIGVLGNLLPIFLETC
jgi:hypothetical protein